MSSDSRDDDRIDNLRERIAELEARIPDGPSRRQVLAGGGLLAAGGLLGGGASQQVSAQSAAGQVGTSSEPVDVEAASVNAGSVNAEKVGTGEYRISGTDGENRLRDVLDNLAGYGDTVVIESGFDITASSTLTIPEGVEVRGPHRLKTAGTPPQITKGFNGDLLEYNDWVQLHNIAVDGNGGSYTGDNIVPASANNRELYWTKVLSTNAAGAAFVENETYLSTFIGCMFHGSQDGLAVEGTQHSPHNNYIRCRFTRNDRAGVDVRYNLDQKHFIGCLIDENLYGIDTERSSVGLPISRTAFSGTFISVNDGPGIILQGPTSDNMALQIDASSIVAKNVQSPPAGLTSTNGVGDVHSENGGRISGTVVGVVGDIRRYNSNGGNTDLTILGKAGDIEVPDTFITVANDRAVGSVIAKSGVGLDPTGGGGLSNY